MENLWGQMNKIILNLGGLIDSVYLHRALLNRRQHSIRALRKLQKEDSIEAE